MTDRIPQDLESLLDGATPSLEGSRLPSFLAALRGDAVDTEPRPSPALAELLENGLVPVAPVASPQEVAATPSGISTWRRRIRVGGQALVAKFAALGLLAKTAAAGAAVTVATAGAGAAGVLPAPAQEAFTNFVDGDSITEAPPPEVADDDPGATPPSPQVPVPPAPEIVDSPAPSDGVDGGEVADDGTGDSDGEPGVDGPEVAEEATERDDEPPADEGAPAPEAERAPATGEDATQDRAEDMPQGGTDEAPSDRTDAAEQQAEPGAGEAPEQPRDDGQDDPATDPRQPAA